MLGSDFDLSTLQVGRGRPRPGRAARRARGRGRGRPGRRGPRGGRPLLVRARAHARDALRAADREPPAAAAPARRRGARERAAAGASGRAGASLLPGARGRRRGQGDRVQPAGGRGAPRRRTPTRTPPSTTSARSAVLELVGRDDAAARCDVLLALGAARWQASEPDAALDVPAGARAGARARLARPAGARGARRGRALLRARWRRTSPTPTCSRRRSTALEPGDSALRVRVLARLAENLVFAEPAERAVELAGEAVEMARRLGEPHALAAALMGRHAALLHAEHAHERRRDRRGDARARRRARRRPSWPRWRATGCCTTSPSWASSTRRTAPARRARAARRRAPAAALPAFGARLARRVERARGPLRRGRAARPRRRPAGRGRRRSRRAACTSPRSSSPCGASRAGSTSCWRTSSGSPATSPTPPRGAASCRSPTSTPATASAPAAAYERALAGGRRRCRATCTG